MKKFTLKRNNIIIFGMVLLIVTICGFTKKNNPTHPKTEENNSKKISSHIALNPQKNNYKKAKEKLIKGNQRYIKNKLSKKDFSYNKREKLHKDGQKPFATILSCSDSRVPPELIFDDGLGELFVIRDAGNVVDQLMLGSIEYGAEHLGSSLIVVLGHENCGAVKATVEGAKADENVSSIINLIKPSLDKVKNKTTNENKLCQFCENENIKNSISIINNNPVIKNLDDEGKVKVVGAKYDIDTGRVSFFD